MKRVFLVVVIVFFLGFGLWFLNKNYFHLIENENNDVKENKIEKVIPEQISALPGSCLIFEEKNCRESGTPIYDSDGKLVNLTFKIDKGDYIFSPIDGDIKTGEISFNNDKKMLVVTVGKMSFEEDGESSMVYQFTVDGELLGDLKKVFKGQPIIRINNVEEDIPNVLFQIFEYTLKDTTVFMEINKKELEKFIDNSDAE